MFYCRPLDSGSAILRRHLSRGSIERKEQLLFQLLGLAKSVFCSRVGHLIGTSLLYEKLRKTPFINKLKDDGALLLQFTSKEIICDNLELSSQLYKERDFVVVLAVVVVVGFELTLGYKYV